MKKFIALLLLISTPALAGTAFFSHEVISGMNKICYYNHLGSTVAITLRSTQMCAVTITI
jgi:hypothetical protein